MYVQFCTFVNDFVYFFSSLKLELLPVGVMVESCLYSVGEKEEKMYLYNKKEHRFVQTNEKQTRTNIHGEITDHLFGFCPIFSFSPPQPPQKFFDSHLSSEFKTPRKKLHLCMDLAT